MPAKGREKRKVDGYKKTEMKYEEILEILDFSQEWIDLAIINPEVLEKLRRIHEEELEEVKNETENIGTEEEYSWESARIDSEHFRYRAFKMFLKENEPLPSDTVKILYKLGESDPDYTMRRSIMREVLDQTNCP